MFCTECGVENKDGAKFCNSCGKSLTDDLAQSAVISSKHNEVIKAKITTKEQQIKDISQIGPVLLCLLGIPCLFLYIIPGLILIGIAIWWSQSRENEKKKLQNEIKELQAELD